MAGKKIDLDAIDLESLDDYDSEDLETDAGTTDEQVAARGRNDYVSDMWGRYGFTNEGVRSTSAARRAEAVVTAHQLVQGFVDTFATGDVRFRVAFDPNMSTAGTDFNGKVIAISPGPVFDPTLEPRDAGVILTAMAVHEASHVRYGRSTDAAVRRTFGGKRTPLALSNILDDVRIERRFAQDYPGYADVFRPMIAYVAAGLQKKYGDQEMTLRDPLNVVIPAVRFAEHVEWKTDELREERDWWQAWAERWSREDAPRRHVEGVREGLRRLALLKIKEQERAAREQAKKRPSSKPGVPMTPEMMKIREILKSLDPLTRKALRLSSEGKTGPEIAAVLDLSVDETRTRIRDVRRRLAGVTRTSRISDLTAGLGYEVVK